jgi:hypothetical protein
MAGNPGARDRAELSVTAGFLLKRLNGGLLFPGFWLLLFFCGFQDVAFAVVDLSTPYNTNAPADGAPWDNVGWVNGASGVYLGSGWVLTAAHVGAGNASLAGTTYAYDGTSRRLTNANGSNTDLVVFHLSSSPLLPSLPLCATTPAAWTTVDMIGYGGRAGSVETNLGSYTGFYWSARGLKSWGYNKALGRLTNINEGLGDLTTMLTRFSAPGSTGDDAPLSDEGQAAGGDSGGGVFVYAGAAWRLAGIMDSVDVFDTQPAGSSAYGNMTYSADIATYRSQIQGIIGRSDSPGLAILVAGTNAILSWSDSAAGFELQACTNLARGGWSTVAAGLASTNGYGCLSLTPGGGRFFYRLKGP